MTNSFFNFIEAPDFASAIAETYRSVNASYDRREQLERENDATRLKNAAMPLKMIQALADFAPKAKKLEDKFVADNQRESVFFHQKNLKELRKLKSI